ncbi:MAG: Ig-like domain-containing protein, partial [Verrucomicrobiia bacterium]
TLTGSDVDGDTLSYTVVTQPAHGTLTGTAPALTYTPNADYNGSDSFTFKVNDGTVDSAIATVSITVNSVNDAPVINNQTFSIAENSGNGVQVGIVVASDVDAGQTLTFSIISGNTNGTFTIGASNGKITIANNALLNYEAIQTWQLLVKVTDNGTPSLSSTGTVTIAVIDVNEAPVISPQTFTVPENSANGTAVGTVLATDPDNGQTLNYQIISGNTNGAFAINSANGQITVANSAMLNYETAPVWTLVVSVTDNGSPNLTSSATITINLSNVNEPPTVNSATFSIDENSAPNTVVGTVTATDPDAGTSLIYSIVSGNTNNTFNISPTSGQITVANSALLNYEVTPVWTLTVRATDNGTPQLYGEATITINLNNVNDPPTVISQTFNVPENSNNGTVVGTVTATDEDSGQTLTYSISGGNTNSAFAINSASGQITVNNGSVLDHETVPIWQLTVQVTDNGTPVNSSTATITINITDVNEKPIANPQNVTTAEDTAKVITLTGSDPENGTLTYTILTQPAHGTLSGTPPNVTYTPAANYNGADSFTFKVNDGTFDSDPATVSITVNSVNDAPVANPQSVTTAEDTQVNITLTGSDVENDPLTFAIVTPPAHGTLSGTPPNVTYTPAADYNGADSFTFKVNDGQLDSLPATISITITAVNDPPVANSQTLTTDEDIPINITLTGSDVDGDDLSFVIDTPPAHGTLSGTAPNIVYTPGANYFGSDSFTFKAFDGTVYSAPATVSITINYLNDPPTVQFSTNLVVVEENSGLTNIAGFLQLLSPGEYETNQTIISFSITNNTPSLFATQPTIDTTNGTLTFRPYPSTYGTAVVSVVAIDSSGETNNTTYTQFMIIVSKYNNPPTITPIGNQVITEDSSMAPVAFTIGDVDSPIGNLTVSYTSTNTALIPLSYITIGGSGANRTVSATPVSDGNGVTKITITVTDNHPFFPKTASTSFILTVQAINDPPSFTMGQNITVSKSPINRSYAMWATNISPGPANESFQSVVFILTADNQSLFSTQPAVSPSGTLSFKPAGVAGTATITIYAKDNGGSGYGGAPYSATNTFTITLTP